MFHKHHKAFSMIELVFVIVVIGILAAIAIPKFAATRGDAIMTKTKATVAGVRSSMATERQKRILRGDFTAITSLNSTGTNSAFSTFSADQDGTTTNVLEYSLSDCTGLGKTQGCWSVTGTTYRFNLPTSGFVDFNITNSRFNCKVPTDANCIRLTQ